MKEIHFWKMQGLGNDFIALDFENYEFLEKSEIPKLCNRYYGIGADGLFSVKVENKDHIRLYYHNADGTEGMFCGNGARCAVTYANQFHNISKAGLLLASDGAHEYHLQNSDVKIQMFEKESLRPWKNGYYVHTGAPHVVYIHEELKSIDFQKWALPIRNHPDFQPWGTNVNAICIENNYVAIRTFEKGIEGETLACGTGMVAAALVAKNLGLSHENSIKVRARGGEISVDIYEKIFMTGKATFVFNGKIFI